MTSTSEVSNLANIFSNIRTHLAIYVYCPLFVIGNIGNILNMIIFTRESLRTNACPIYFLLVSIFNLITINIGYFTRILPLLNVPDPSRNIAWYCKGRAYITGLSLTLTRHFLCVIAIDRFLITSTRVSLRQLSSFKTAKWIILISCTSWAIFYIHTIFGYENTRGGTSCGRQAGFYSTFTTICTISIDAILPIVIMTTFTLLMLKHVHAMQLRQAKAVLFRKRNLIIPITNINSIQNSRNQEENNHRRIEQQKENQLNRFSLIQIFIYIIFNLPNAVYVVYMLVATNDKKTADQIAIESFVSSFVSIMTFIYCTLNFYIYTLSSRTYRRKTKQILRQCFNLRQTRIFPFQN
ncbi:hypothetical protein I4U23_021699 [Adineta vaga]|nr:hypothetical protein I4U23_021699 [Adineta vaga]